MFLRENIWGVENSQIFTVTPWKTIHCLRSLQQTMRGPFGMIDYCMVRLYFLFLKFSQESGTYRGGILKSPLLRSWCQEIMGIKAAACVYNINIIQPEKRSSGTLFLVIPSCMTSFLLLLGYNALCMGERNFL